MRFAIVGPGALGSVIAATLSRSGHDVSLLGRPSPHLRALRERGLHLTTRNGDIEHLNLAATDDPAVVRGADAVIVLVKSGDTAAAMQAIRPHLHPGQVVLTLQNGLGNAECIGDILGEGARILSGVTSQAATRIEPGAVVHTGEGSTLIGFRNEREAPVAAQLAQVFTAAGLAAVATPDIDRWIWSKVAVNAAINGLTALGGITNGAIASDPMLLGAAEIIAEEAAAVARAKGFEIGGMRRAVLETATATADNRSSMLQDLDAGRRTEVAAIHGTILAAGEETGVDTPAIRVIAALIEAKERAMTMAAPTDG